MKITTLWYIPPRLYCAITQKPIYFEVICCLGFPMDDVKKTTRSPGLGVQCERRDSKSGPPEHEECGSHSTATLHAGVEGEKPL
jgi:hypothetical protein